MFELPIAYKCRYDSDYLEILQPIIEENTTIIDTNFNILHAKNANLYINYKHIHTIIMDALLAGDKVIISKTENLNYLQENSIEIIKSSSNKQDFIDGYFLYLTKDLQNDFYISYMSTKKHKDWDSNNIISVSKTIFDTIKEQHTEEIYFKITYNPLESTSFDLSLDNIEKNIYYISTDNNLRIFTTTLVANNILTKTDIKLTMSPSVYNILIFLQQTYDISFENVIGFDHLNLLTFIKNNFVKVNVKDSLFDKNLNIKNIISFSPITGWESSNFYAIFKQEPLYSIIDSYIKAKQNLTLPLYQLYIKNLKIKNIFKTHYLENFIKNSIFINNSILSNALFYDKKNKTYTPITNITESDIDNIYYFKTLSDILLYYTIDIELLTVTHNEQTKKLTLALNIPLLESSNEFQCLRITPYSKKQNIIETCNETLVDFNNVFILPKTNDLAMYITQLNSKGFVATYPNDITNIKDLKIQNILVQTQESTELILQKTLLKKQQLNDINLTSTEDTFLDLPSYLTFALMLQEFSLYGIFIHLEDSLNIEEITEKLEELKTIDVAKYNTLITYLPILKNSYDKYSKIYKKFLYVLQQQIDIDKVTSKEELVTLKTSYNNVNLNKI